MHVFVWESLNLSSASQAGLELANQPTTSASSMLVLQGRDTASNLIRHFSKRRQRMNEPKGKWKKNVTIPNERGHAVKYNWIQFEKPITISATGNKWWKGGTEKVTCMYGPFNIMCVCVCISHGTHAEHRGKLFRASLYSTMSCGDKPGHQACIRILPGEPFHLFKNIDWVAGIVLDNLYFTMIFC